MVRTYLYNVPMTTPKEVAFLTFINLTTSFSAASSLKVKEQVSSRTTEIGSLMLEAVLPESKAGIPSLLLAVHKISLRLLQVC